MCIDVTVFELSHAFKYWFDVAVNLIFSKVIVILLQALRIVNKLAIIEAIILYYSQSNCNFCLLSVLFYLTVFLLQPILVVGGNGEPHLTIFKFFLSILST